MNETRKKIVDTLKRLRASSEVDRLSLIRNEFDGPLNCSNGQDIELCAVGPFGIDIHSLHGWLSGVIDNNPTEDITVQIQSVEDYDGYPDGFVIDLSHRQKESDSAYLARLTRMLEEVTPIDGRFSTRRSDNIDLNKYIEFLENNQR